MGKRIIPRRRGRGHRWKAPDNRFKGDARHPRSKSSNGKVIELMHDPGRTAPIAKISDQDGIYTMIAHDGMHVGQDVATGHGAQIDVGNTSYVGSIPLEEADGNDDLDHATNRGDEGDTREVQNIGV